MATQRLASELQGLLLSALVILLCWDKADLHFNTMPDFATASVYIFLLFALLFIIYLARIVRLFYRNWKDIRTKTALGLLLESLKSHLLGGVSHTAVTSN